MAAEPITSLKLNHTYTFGTIAPAVLGANFSNVTVIGSMVGEEAAKEFDVATIHASIVSQVPNVQLPMNYLDCTYYKLINKSNPDLVTIIALEYIDLDSVEEVSNNKLIITVNNFNTGDPGTIKKLLNGLGYYDIAFRVESTKS